MLDKIQLKSKYCCFLRNHAEAQHSTLTAISFYYRYTLLCLIVGGEEGGGSENCKFWGKNRQVHLIIARE